VSTEPIPTDGKRRPEDLTPREVEILRLIWEGHTNRSIAACLKISMKTADTHRANMMKKLRASNTAQLLKAALERKLLQTTDVDAQVSGVQ
jgi:DNA-binding NarL/FixJ family response regulator